VFCTKKFLPEPAVVTQSQGPNVTDPRKKIHHKPTSQGKGVFENKPAYLDCQWFSKKNTTLKHWKEGIQKHFLPTSFGSSRKKNVLFPTISKHWWHQCSGQPEEQQIMPASEMWLPTGQYENGPKKIESTGWKQENWLVYCECLTLWGSHDTWCKVSLGALATVGSVDDFRKRVPKMGA